MWFLLAVLLLGSEDKSPWWSVQASGLDTNLRGVSVKFAGGDEHGRGLYLIWAAGSNGVILRSEDSGKKWKQLSVKNGGDLDFRGIEAVDTNVAYVMSSGDGGKSRIYKTTDGGAHWQLQYSDPRPGFFLDSLACDSPTHCVALSDPVGGRFVVIGTNDGEHWNELPRDRMPAALPNEGAFAASGTAIALCGGRDDKKILFGTGGPAARVFRSDDAGRSWTVSVIPIAAGNASSGIFSIACYEDDLVAVGGDYKDPGKSKAVAAYSDDAGDSWHPAVVQPGGYRSAVAAFSPQDFAAVGVNGTDISHDKGAHWQHTDRLALNALSFEGMKGWAVGAKGTIARFKTHFEYEIRSRPFWPPSASAAYTKPPA